MASIPDLINLLRLEARHSLSPFGGQHRTISISKDFTNSGDFVFNNLLQHFARKEPNTPILLITLNQDWSNYSASAAKCGFNLRRTQNMGNIEVINMMSLVLESTKKGERFNAYDYLIEAISNFISEHSPELHEDMNSVARVIKPVVVMIDDLSILLNNLLEPSQIFRLFCLIDKSLRDRSRELPSNQLSRFVVQTMVMNNHQNCVNQTPAEQSSPDHDLNYLVSNIENLCDISITLKPLETGYSTRVDGTIKIVDNRLPAPAATSKTTSADPLQVTPSLFPDGSGQIGMKKAFFYKVSDRRVRLTSSALIF